MAELAEFKVQVDGQSWEETEVTWQDLYDDNFWACYAAQCAAQLTGRQIRWNWVGSLQGHYAYPDRI